MQKTGCFKTICKRQISIWKKPCALVNLSAYSIQFEFRQNY
jgi:hypothetical protein